MYKIAVMGDRDSIYGFASVGLDIFPVEGQPEAARCLRRLEESGYAIIYMTEKLFGELEKEVRVLEERVIPAVIPIPGVSGNTGIGIARVKKSVERAVGADIFFR